MKRLHVHVGCVTCAWLAMQNAHLRVVEGQQFQQGETAEADEQSIG